MDETRAIARLPHLGVEIGHRRLPVEQADGLAISLRASPRFEAVGRYLDAQAVFWRWLAVDPLLAWLRLLRAAWQPWLQAPARRRAAPLARGR